MLSLSHGDTQQYLLPRSQNVPFPRFRFDLLMVVANKFRWKTHNSSETTVFVDFSFSISPPAVTHIQYEIIIDRFL